MAATYAVAESTHWGWRGGKGLERGAGEAECEFGSWNGEKWMSVKRSHGSRTATWAEGFLGAVEAPRGGIKWSFSRAACALLLERGGERAREGPRRDRIMDKDDEDDDGRIRRAKMQRGAASSWG